jgi:hypothetical protein
VEEGFEIWSLVLEYILDLSFDRIRAAAEEAMMSEGKVREERGREEAGKRSDSWFADQR